MSELDLAMVAERISRHISKQLDNPNRFMTLQEIADFYGFQKSYVQRLWDDKILACYQINNRKGSWKSDVDNHILNIKSNAYVIKAAAPEELTQEEQQFIDAVKRAEKQLARRKK